MSEHEVLVVEVEQVRKHENADSLDVVKVSGYDYSIIVRRESFSVGELGVFVEPDYVVPTDRAEFQHLFDGKPTKRITAKRLRGIWSEGLLFKANPEVHTLGMNVMEEYGITRWEPTLKSSNNGFGAELLSGWCAKSPNIPGLHEVPKYDLENFKKYSKILEPDETVFYTTKIHGASARYVFSDGEMYCGSRTTWKLKPGSKLEYNNPRTGEVITKEAPDCTWWSALESNPWIEAWCRSHPNMVLYGEVFGPMVQGTPFHYGQKDGQVGFRVFDVLRDKAWVSFKELTANTSEFSELKLVPMLFHGKHNRATLEELAEAKETSIEGCGANHIREGVVIKPSEERWNERLGRVALKYVSNNYLTKS